MYGEEMKSVALNDLHLLNVKTKVWVTVAIFSDFIPESRWGH